MDDLAVGRALGLHQRKEAERFKPFAYTHLIKGDKVSLDIFWLKDDSLEDSANLPDPDVIAAEIAEDLQAALDQFALIAGGLRSCDVAIGKRSFTLRPTFGPAKAIRPNGR